MSTKFFLAITFASTLIFAQIGLAEPLVCKEKFDKMVNSLTLEDSQKAKIKPILDQLKEKQQATGSKMDTLEPQITKELNSDDKNLDNLYTLVDKKVQLIGEKIKAEIAAKKQIFAILKPHQKAELQDKMKKAGEKIAAGFKQCDED